MKALAVTDVARDFRKVIDTVERDREEIVLVRNRKQVARLVPERAAQNAMGPHVNDLVLHAFDPATVPPGTALHADVGRKGAFLSLRWTLTEHPDAVAIATRTAAPARRDRLWESTCFEVFLAPAGRPEYWEVNLSPSGDWNVYRFDRERTGMRPEPRVAAPLVEAATAASARFTLTAQLDLAPVAELAAAPLDAAITAVLEAASGGRSYWALRHTRPQPDFHARDSFVVTLDR